MAVWGRRRKRVSFEESWRNTGNVEEPYNLPEMMIVTRALVATWFWLVGEPLPEPDEPEPPQQ